MKVNFKITKNTQIVWNGKPHNKDKVIEGMDKEVALKYQGKGMGEIVSEYKKPKVASTPKKSSKMQDKSKEDSK